MDQNSTPDTPIITPGYPLLQLAKALTTASEHGDQETRERACSKISKWMRVFEGVLTGAIAVGSRRPFEEFPAWTTLEVLTGGFATGHRLAGGPLMKHERALLAALPPFADSEARRALNAYYLSEKGLSELQGMLRSGCYSVSVPEEGVLLLVAWLVQNESGDQARALLEELGPFFSDLRFYPIPSERPPAFGSRVFLKDVGGAIADLGRITRNPRILAQKEAIEIWTPLYERAVSLFLETVTGELPTSGSMAQLLQGNAVACLWKVGGHASGILKAGAPALRRSSMIMSSDEQRTSSAASLRKRRRVSPSCVTICSRSSKTRRH